jgi:LL-diaminopimelate aminotransferase
LKKITQIPPEKGVSGGLRTSKGVLQYAPTFPLTIETIYNYHLFNLEKTMSKFNINNKLSQRLSSLEDYVFQSLNQAKEKFVQKELIDLGAGNPDLPPPQEIIESLITQAKIKENHRHPIYEGIKELREEIASWFFKRFKVKLDPEKEVLVLLGTKEGLGHISLALINPGDFALISNPAYPVYARGVYLAGGKISYLPLKKENNWLLDLEKVNPKILRKAKVLFLNYPNNPTGAIAPKKFLHKVVDFAQKNEIVILNDMAYSEITYDGYRTNSILESKKGLDVCLEFHSFSKTFSMTGWRLGFVVGNRILIDALKKIKLTYDSGPFTVIQKAAINALRNQEKISSELRKVYQKRRDILWAGLNSVGFEVEKPKGAIFLWAKIPTKESSKVLAKLLLEKCGIITTPGWGLGSEGKDFLRFSLTAPEEKIKEAIRRMKDYKDLRRN